MKLYIRQRVFSWADRFVIKGEDGADRYSAQGEIFSWGKKLHIYDAGGYEAAFIRQKLMSFMPCFFIEAGGRELCRITKEFTLFVQRYRIDGLPWHVEGDFWAHEYALRGKGRDIMRMSKHWFTWGDSYELDIPEPADELPALCVALAIDCAVALGQND